MSFDRDTSQHNSNKITALPAPSKKRSHSEYLLGVDARFKHLADDLFPSQPYLLTVPTDKPYRLGGRTVTNWAVGKGCLFAPEEEQLQYMTFLARQAEDTLLVAVGGWSDEHGNIMQEEESSKPAAEQGNNPSRNGQQKKKITFKDYKKALESPAPPTPPAMVNGKAGSSPPKEGISEAPKESTSDSATVSKKREDTQKLNGIPTPKTTSKQEAKLVPPKRVDRPSPSPPKKPRVDKQSNQGATQSSSPTKNPPAVPDLLSPTLPTGSLQIPPLLSPTLPPELEEELLSFADELLPEKHLPSTAKKTASKNASTQHEFSRPRSDSVSSTNAKSDTKLKAPSSSLAARNNTKNSPIPAQLPQRSIKKVPVSAPAKPKPAPASVASKPVPPNSAKLKLIVKLRYGRQNRKRVEALLRFPTKRKTTSEKAPAKTKGQEETSSKKESRTSLPSKPADKQRESTVGTKRLKPADEPSTEGPASKRPKTAPSTSSDRPQTPTVPSTTKATGQQSKGQFLTPKKEIRPDSKGVTMRRTGSTESGNKTPAAKVNSAQEDRPNSKPSPALSVDTQSTKAQDLERRAWRDEWSKYKDIGRELKHASDRLVEGSSDAKLGAVTAVEAVLGFILAFIADDRCKALSRQTGDSSNWRSLIPYWQVVARRTAQYSHLHAVCLFLGAIAQDAVHTLDLERFASIGLPGDSPSNGTSSKDRAVVSTPGSHDPDNPSLCSSTSTQDARLFRDLSDLRTRLPESHREASRLWLEGSRLLPDITLAREYPATWLRRSRNFSERGKEVLKVGGYSGDFFLPLVRSGSGTAGAIDGVRFACAFLQEWCEKEDIVWNSRLNL